MTSKQIRDLEAMALHGLFPVPSAETTRLDLLQELVAQVAEVNETLREALKLLRRLTGPSALPGAEGIQDPIRPTETRPSPCTCVNSGIVECPVHGFNGPGFDAELGD